MVLLQRGKENHRGSIQQKDDSSERGDGNQHQSEGSERQQVIILTRATVMVKSRRKQTKMNINRNKLIRIVA